jgi:hypothetical protein
VWVVGEAERGWSQRFSAKSEWQEVSGANNPEAAPQPVRPLNPVINCATVFSSSPIA